MHTVVHFFLQIRAPHVVYARRNSHDATRSGSDQRPPACVLRKKALSVKKATRSAVTDMGSNAIGKCTNIG